MTDSLNKGIRSFIVCSPPYRNSSAGVICLHELCDMLFKLGFEAYLVIMDGSAPNFTFHITQDPKHFHSSLKHSGNFFVLEEEKIRAIIEDGITIYPEVVVGNPLGAKRVVRYFLNHDGIVTGHKSNFSQKDFILAYDPQYFNEPHHVLYKPITDECFNDLGAPGWDKRLFNLTYIGKGSNYLNCGVVDKTIEITRNWPSTKPELAFLLRNSKYLFCWDNQTQLSIDAILCGTKPVFLQDIQVDRSKGFYGPFGKLPFVMGNLLANNIELVQENSYEEDRNLFIKNYKMHLDRWRENVADAVAKILHFFN